MVIGYILKCPAPASTVVTAESEARD